MPDQKFLGMNYLPRLFNNHLNYIMNIVSRRKISSIIDESPDIFGRKAVNSFSFYNERKKEKTVLLISSFSESFF